MAQWGRIRLPMQETRVWEDPTCLRTVWRDVGRGGEDIGERGGDRSGKGTQSPAETAGGQSSSGGSEGVCAQPGAGLGVALCLLCILSN